MLDDWVKQLKQIIGFRVMTTLIISVDLQAFNKLENLLRKDHAIEA